MFLEKKPSLKSGKVNSWCVEFQQPMPMPVGAWILERVCQCSLWSWRHSPLLDQQPKGPGDEYGVVSASRYPYGRVWLRLVDGMTASYDEWHRALRDRYP